MANTKLSQLPAATALAATDLLPIAVDNHDSTYTSKKITASLVSNKYVVKFVFGDGVNVPTSPIATNSAQCPQSGKITKYHGLATYSWKFLPLVLFPTTEIEFPVEIEIHKCVCIANQAQTIKIWAMRDNVGLSVGIRVKELNLTGVATTDVLCTAAINTWQQLTLTFTPTQSGVISIYGIAYGGTTYSGWLSDLTPMANQPTKLLTTSFGGQPFSTNAGDSTITPALAYIQ